MIYEGRDLEALSEMPNYYGWILDVFKVYLTGYCAEFGAGKGTFSTILQDHVEHLVLVEPSPNLCELLQGIPFERTHCEIIESTLESAVKSIPVGSLDSVVMINVLEHIEDDLTALRDVRCLLKSGGHLMLFVPALQWLYSRFDEVVGHYRRYHLAVLLNTLRMAGFDIEQARYFDLLGVIPWLVVNRLFGRTELDPRMTSLYDRYAVPVGRILESRLPIPFGKNILAVARVP